MKPHPKDNELYPKETEVLCKKGFNASKKAVIKDYTFQFQGKGFLHYEAEIVGRKGRYCLLHDEIEVISFTG